MKVKHIPTILKSLQWSCAGHMWRWRYHPHLIVPVPLATCTQPFESSNLFMRRVKALVSCNMTKIWTVKARIQIRISQMIWKMAQPERRVSWTLIPLSCSLLHCFHYYIFTEASDCRTVKARIQIRISQMIWKMVQSKRRVSWTLMHFTSLLPLLHFYWSYGLHDYSWLTRLLWSTLLTDEDKNQYQWWSYRRVIEWCGLFHHEHIHTASYSHVLLHATKSGEITSYITPNKIGKKSRHLERNQDMRVVWP